MAEQRRKVSSGWQPDMERRAGHEDGRQVRCLAATAGHLWMPDFDILHPAIRGRLAGSRHNICANCLTTEVRRVAKKRGLRPTVGLYFAVIDAIERELDNGSPPRRTPNESNSDVRQFP